MRALELYLDEEADERVRALWRQLEDAGISSLASRTHQRHRPHVSLTVASGISPSVEESLAEMLEEATELSLRLESLAMFPGEAGVLYLGVVPTTELIGMHARVSQHLAEREAEAREHYMIGRWIPHCTLAHDLSNDDISRAFGLLAGGPPIEARIVAAGLVEITSGEVTPLIGDEGPRVSR